MLNIAYHVFYVVLFFDIFVFFIVALAASYCCTHTLLLTYV
jgi:hypothetical protein